MSKCLIAVLFVIAIIAMRASSIYADGPLTVTVDIPTAQANAFLSVNVDARFTKPSPDAPCTGIIVAIMHYPDPVDGVATGIDETQVGGQWQLVPDSVIHVNETYDFIPTISGAYDVQVNVIVLCDVAPPVFIGTEVHKIVEVQ